MKKHIKSTVAIAVLLIIVPLIWFAVDSNNILSAIGVKSLGNTPSNWTDAFLGYLGSASATIIGYVAVVITIIQQEKSRREDNAKEVLPLLSIEPYHGTVSGSIVVTNGDYESACFNVATSGVLRIRNVGMRELYSLTVSMKSDKFSNIVTDIEMTPILYKDNSEYICVYPIVEGKPDDKGNIHVQEQAIKACGELDISIEMTFSYQDCYGNKYTQDFRIFGTSKLNTRRCGGDTVTYTGVVIDRCNIVGAPKLQK